MNGPDILASFGVQLAQAISTAPCHPMPPDPLPISPWGAMSLLQKAIRRGEDRFALEAAATLLNSAPDRLWRRLGCIAFEDISSADIETAGLVTVAVGSKRFRTSLGVDWLVARHLISRMVQTLKSRASVTF